MVEEKELTRRSDEIAATAEELPWVRIEKEYRFDTEKGMHLSPDLFCGRSQLLIYHFMFGPDYAAGCPHCSAIADGFNPVAVHLANHDVMLWAVSGAARSNGAQAPLGMDISVGVFVQERLQLRLQCRIHGGATEIGKCRLQLSDQRLLGEGRRGSSQMESEIAATAGTDWATFTRKAPGMARS